jgi:hypothetical protein
MPPSALSRASHRTGAMAHGLADILAYQAGSRARGRRTETAQTRVSQNAGSATCARYPGGNSPFPRKWTNGMSYPRSGRIRTVTGIQRLRWPTAHSDEVAGGAVHASEAIPLGARYLGVEARARPRASTRDRSGQRDRPGGLADRNAARDLDRARPASGGACESSRSADDRLDDVEELRVAGKSDADVAVGARVSG